MNRRSCRTTTGANALRTEKANLTGTKSPVEMTQNLTASAAVIETGTVDLTKSHFCLIDKSDFFRTKCSLRHMKHTFGARSAPRE